jgi:hypothetical protein
MMIEQLYFLPFCPIFQILHDIEERAPGLKRQREEYDQVMESLKAMEKLVEDEHQVSML